MLVSAPGGPIDRIVVARTVLGRPLYTVSIYRIGATLVDSGPPATASELLSWARDEGIRRIVHTHHHEDHVGGDAVLAAELGVRSLAPEGTVARSRADRIPLYRRLVWGVPRPFDAEAFDREVEIQGGSFRAIPTPGHAPDHVALWNPDRRWLFSGDLYVARRVRYLRRDEDVRTLMASLRRIADLDPEWMFCAHAGPVSDGKRVLEEKIGYWDSLARDARRLADEGLSLRRITRRLLGREGLLYYLSGGDFAKRNLVGSLLGPGGPDES